MYVNNIDPEIDVEQKGTLSKAYLGKCKDCLDLIDVSVDRPVGSKFEMVRLY